MSATYGGCNGWLYFRDAKGVLRKTPVRDFDVDANTHDGVGPVDVRFTCYLPAVWSPAEPGDVVLLRASGNRLIPTLVGCVIVTHTEMQAGDITTTVVKCQATAGLNIDKWDLDFATVWDIAEDWYPDMDADTDEAMTPAYCCGTDLAKHGSAASCSVAVSPMTAPQLHEDGEHTGPRQPSKPKRRAIPTGDRAIEL